MDRQTPHVLIQYTKKHVKCQVVQKWTCYFLAADNFLSTAFAFTIKFLSFFLSKWWTNRLKHVIIFYTDLCWFSKGERTMNDSRKGLNIAMFGHKRIPSREGGVEIVVAELSTRMAASGHSVTCFNRSGHHVSDRKYPIPFQQQL